MFAVGTFFILFASGQVQKFNGIRIDAPAKASKRNATSQVGDKIIELFSSAKTTRVFIITADDSDFGNHIFDRITSVTSKEGSALEIDAENCLSEYSLVSNVVGRHLDGTSDALMRLLAWLVTLYLLARLFQKEQVLQE